MVFDLSSLRSETTEIARLAHSIRLSKQTSAQLASGLPNQPKDLPRPNRLTRSNAFLVLRGLQDGIGSPHRIARGSYVVRANNVCTLQDQRRLDRKRSAQPIPQG